VISAHGGDGSSGSLLFALPLVVLGIALFIQRSTSPAVPVILVGIGIAVAVGGFTLGGSHGRYETMFLSLCSARDVAAHDPGAAATTFTDDVHGPLHEFADALSEKDRAAAADVLETKQRVEAVLAQGNNPEDALGALTVSVERALPIVGEEGVTCESS
jgi:hypothetical protein